MLKRHLAKRSPDDTGRVSGQVEIYQRHTRWSPLRYAATRSQLAKDSGLGRKVEAAPPKKAGRQKRK